MTRIDSGYDRDHDSNADVTIQAPAKQRNKLLLALTLGAKLLLPSAALTTAACGNDTVGEDDEAGVTTNMSSTATDSTTTTDSGTSTDTDSGTTTSTESTDEDTSSSSEGSEGTEGSSSQGEVGDTTTG